MRPWLLLALASCATSSADPRDTPERRFERDVMTRYHMHQNYDLVRAIERLLIRGKLDDAQRFATAIEIAPEEADQQRWATYTVAVRERAGEIARAKTVDDGIRGIAKLGAACGNCHGAFGVTPEFGKLPRVPTDKPTIEARMLRHRWAADRLWEGVVGNNDDAWREGLELLSAVPLDEPADRAAFARKLQHQAGEARKPSAGPLVDRASTYGDLLVTCASCHTARPAR
jgi:cytochrome c553